MHSRKSTRHHVRIRLKVPLEVFYAEYDGAEWTENSFTENITVCGAGFTLSHPVALNRLVRLRLAMPKQFRLFDYSKEQYEVWALIRYVRLIESSDSDQIRLMAGAAFIGDAPPQSFLSNQNTSYDLMPVLQNRSFWQLREKPRNTGAYARSSEERKLITVKVKAQLINEQGRKIDSDEAETLNISESGAAIITKLKPDGARYVLISAEEQNISLLATVRGTYPTDSPDLFRFHLEFISGKWLF